MFDKKRFGSAVILGMFMGMICLLGMSTRYSIQSNELFFIATWYNRLIMGIVIGLTGEIMIVKKQWFVNAIIRGFIFGLIITSSLYLATDLRDILGFYAGLIYGIVIDLGSTYYSRGKNHGT